jgi:muramoyltetrapeptide carboxypeptidase
LRKPERLNTGDVVQVIAPASPFKKEKFESGLRILEAFGLRPRWQDDVFSACDYLAGDDTRRAAELRAAFSVGGVAAVLPARGGYGCARACESAGDPSRFQPRFLSGFSDITTLHIYLNDKADLVTFHGPNVTTLSSLEPATLDQYRKTLFGIDPQRTFSWSGLRSVHGGRATGRTLVANLSVLVSLIGTPLQASLAGRILVIEDVNEKPYRLDRLLHQLSFVPDFAGVAGVVFGDFLLEGEDVAVFERTVARYSDRWGIPVATGFPVGHGILNDSVPQNVIAEFDSDKGRLAVVEDPYGDVHEIR